jgi:hypothetical protein
MKQSKLIRSITFFLGFLAIETLVTLFSLQAQSLPQQIKSIDASASVTFEPPDGDRPQDTAGGASRNDGKCPQDAKNLEPYITLLLPSDRYGLTTESHPTFFVYLPQTIAQKAFFSLQDEAGETVYQNFLSLNQKAGVVGIKLPAEAASLEVGKTYKWSIALVCDRLLQPDSPSVEGQVRRVEVDASLSGQSQDSTPLQRAALYGKAGLWYDTLTLLAESQRAQPGNTELKAVWEKFLTSVELGAIATKPLLEETSDRD